VALYRTRSDGSFELDTDAGPLAMPTSEDELRAAGHMPDHLNPYSTSERAAAPGAPVPTSAANNFGAGGAPAQVLDQDILDGAAGDPRVQKLGQSTEVGNITRETKPLRGREREEGDASKRKGPKQERIAVPGAGGGRGGGGGGGRGGMVPVSRTVTKGVEGLEDAIDQTNLQRHDEYRLERDAIGKQQERAGKQTRAEQALITEEEIALEEERKRRERVNADLEQRQSAIDDERKAIEELKIPPRDIFHNKGDLATALSAMLVLGGALGQAYKGGDNLAEKALEKSIDNEIADQKEKRARRVEGVQVKQTELERLEKIYGTPEAAEAEFRMRAHTLLQRQTESDARQAGADDALETLRARWAKKNQDFELQKLDLRGKLGERVQIQEKMSFGGGGGGGRGAAKPRKIGEAVRKQIAGYDAALAGIDDMEAADNKHGKPALLRTDGGFGASDAAQELAQIGNAIGPGIARATEGDAATKDSMERAIGSLVGRSASQRQQSRDAYRRQILTARDRLLASQGEELEDAPTGGGGVPGEEPE
jgi:hypothetical protein